MYPGRRAVLRRLRGEAERARQQRKVVTVLLCGVTGSTERGERLDPEAFRLVLARYFERMRAIVEHHGGSVEKFIADAWEGGPSASRPVYVTNVA